MLSYRHSYHAGNHADVIKHLIQHAILSYLQQKPKAFCYIDTHAGAGGYSLASKQAQKVKEFETGIAKLWSCQDMPAVIADYVSQVKAFNPGSELTHYPGSPSIAGMMMDDVNKLYLHELHPADATLLKQSFARDRRVKIFPHDGYQGLMSLVPPPQRRGLILIDPPYEVKKDYQQVVETLKKAHKKFATGVYALWYPVVDRYRIDEIEQQLEKSGIRNIQLFELSIKSDTDEKGMTGSGMIVINPPWTLKQQMEEALPWLVKQLSPQQGSFRSEVLVEE